MEINQQVKTHFFIYTQKEFFYIFYYYFIFFLFIYNKQYKNIKNLIGNNIILK